MKERAVETEPRVDSVRRKLLRASIVAGGGLALGQIPYSRPAVKSFFGTREAWAQASRASCGVVTINPIRSGAKSNALPASSQAFRVTNTGGAPFNLTGISTDNPAFTVSSPTPPVALNPGASVDVIVQFACSVPGAQTGSLSLTTDIPDSANACPTAALSGSCAVACGVAPMNLDFGTVGSGLTATEQVTFSNTGDLPIQLDDVTSDDPSFVPQFTGPLTVNPGTSVNVDVEFTCSSPGDFSGNLSFLGTAAGDGIQCSSVPMTATCETVIACEVVPMALTLDDSNMRIDTLDITNVGNVPFTVMNLAIVNELPIGFPQFAFDPVALPQILNPTDTLTVTVNFSSCETDGTAEFEITATAGGGQPVSCANVPLTGTCFGFA